MLPWKSLIPIDRQSPKSVFLQITEGVIKAIRSGYLNAGERLPGSRQMAQILAINRKTALLAYDELLAQGWVISRASKGTFVADCLPVLQTRTWSEEQVSLSATNRFSWEIPDYLTQPIAYSYAMAFDDGLPDIRLAPIEELARAYSRHLRRIWDQRRLSYGDALGHFHLRAVLAKELNNTRGLNITPDHIMITRGSQMAIFLAARIVLSSPQSTVIMTDPGYRTAGSNFRYAGARIKTVPADQEGLVVTALEKICKRQAVDLVYVTPHHHYPTTVMLSPQRRMQLLQLAKRYDFAILEDDYDYDFHYANSPVLPLASGDHFNRVLYIGSFSKNISPAIRMGYLIASPELIQQLPKIRRLIDRQGDMVMEAAIADLLEGGIVRRYLKKALKQYRQRRDLCCDLLQAELSQYLHFEKPAGGLAIWAKFHPDIDLAKLSALMIRKEVYLSDGKFYAPQINAIRMGFASMSETEMVSATTILKQCIQSTFPTFTPGNWKKD